MPQVETKFHSAEKAVQSDECRLAVNQLLKHNLMEEKLDSGIYDTTSCHHHDLNKQTGAKLFLVNIYLFIEKTHYYSFFFVVFFCG